MSTYVDGPTSVSLYATDEALIPSVALIASADVIVPERGGNHQQ